MTEKTDLSTKEVLNAPNKVKILYCIQHFVYKKGIAFAIHHTNYINCIIVNNNCNLP